jgi:GMP synthase-like glutamine amidotransferase
MLPVAILQHDVDVGPGYFRAWLQEQGIPERTIEPYRGDAVPTDAGAFSGVCLMGGPMSVNDPLPWIDDELRLIRRADADGVPVIGHCLGGQLIAKAFGAAVVRHPVKEIGWGQVHVTDAALAREWLGDATPASLEMFQWHSDSFALPAAAANFLASAWCARQAFVIQRTGYAHLGMQFHCEMTPALLRTWTDDPQWLREVETERVLNGGAGVRDAEQMRERAEIRCAAMNRIAARLYTRWSSGLAR